MGAGTGTALRRAPDPLQGQLRSNTEQFVNDLQSITAPGYGTVIGGKLGLRDRALLAGVAITGGVFERSFLSN